MHPFGLEFVVSATGPYKQGQQHQSLRFYYFGSATKGYCTYFDVAISHTITQMKYSNDCCFLNCLDNTTDYTL